jgi:hypothetical protein
MFAHPHITSSLAEQHRRHLAAAREDRSGRSSRGPRPVNLGWHAVTSAAVAVADGVHHFRLHAAKRDALPAG